MKGTRLIVVAALALVLGSAVGVLAQAGKGGGGRPAASPSIPPEARVPVDLGVGEEVFLVVGGVFSERADAVDAARPFGELQGYYVAPVAQFDGLAEHLGAGRSDHVLVSAFRTEEGARQFMELATAAGEAALLTPLVTNRGYVNVGLGQEPNPDGTGPLRGPLPKGPGA